VDTGESTFTGGRVLRIRKFLEGEKQFCLTYGDAVSDVDLKALINCHVQSGLTGTITGVNLSGRFGELTMDGNLITHFAEKPEVASGKVNGGFMVFDNDRFWRYMDWSGDFWLEREPFYRMVQDRQMGVYKHDGFWQCMDTPREYELLCRLWDGGKAPWKTW
jgi:glucose-1-phosphate cytidylyltransferase